MLINMLLIPAYWSKYVNAICYLPNTLNSIFDESNMLNEFNMLFIGKYVVCQTGPKYDKLFKDRYEKMYSF